MAKKSAVTYSCGSCGALSATWSGRCFTCGEWNTLTQQTDDLPERLTKKQTPLVTSTVNSALSKDKQRLESGVSEVDNVLGGGFVAGSVSLIAGQPGIGKSTLLLQLAHDLAKKHSVLYVSGEESAHQVGLRAKRLGTVSNKLQVATTNSTDKIVASIMNGNYELVVVDSIQTMSTEGINTIAGSVGQITNSTQLLSAAAKHQNTAIVLVGHVTKEGSIAGPKVLEHMVDVVLQLEGDRYGGFKVLRAIKNRFGSTNEAGIFEMQDKGLVPVSNPSAALLAERQVSDGSVVLATLEGTRPILVEVQALVNTTSYGYPKRAASGIDLNRVNLLIAMLERRTKLNLADKDVYLNIVGGLKLSEPAADLAVCMAIASAAKGLQLKKNAVVFGELGLSGEVRHVPFLEKRIAEARKLGFELVIGPMLKNGSGRKDYAGVKDVKSALNTFLEKD